MSTTEKRTEIDTEKRPATPSITTEPEVKKQKMSTEESKPVDITAPASNQLPALQIKKLSADAKAPTRGSAFAAGYDMYA